MKKFLIRLLVILLMFYIADCAFGLVCGYLNTHAKHGLTKKMNQITSDITDDVLIFGSSKGVHHYNPLILEDSLKMSVCNCALDGNGIICAYGLWNLITKRYHPQILIYEVTPGLDFLEGDNTNQLKLLKPYYNSKEIKSIFMKVEPRERIGMLFKTYQYNSISKWLIFEYFIPPLHGEYIKGFRPLSNKLDVVIPEEQKQENFSVDSIKLYYLERLIQECKDSTQLIFAVSPWWHNTEEKELEPLKQLCLKYDVPLIDHYCDSTYNFTRELFRDRTHLNANGADKFTKEISVEIRELVKGKYSNLKVDTGIIN